MGLTKRLELENTGDRGVLLIPVQARAVRSRENNKESGNNRVVRTIGNERTIRRQLIEIREPRWVAFRRRVHPVSMKQ